MNQQNQDGSNFIAEMKAVAQAQQEIKDKSDAKSYTITHD